MKSSPKSSKVLSFENRDRDTVLDQSVVNSFKNTPHKLLYTKSCNEIIVPSAIQTELEQHRTLKRNSMSDVVDQRSHDPIPLHHLVKELYLNSSTKMLASSCTNDSGWMTNEERSSCPETLGLLENVPVVFPTFISESEITMTFVLFLWSKVLGLLSRVFTNP